MSLRKILATAFMLLGGLLASSGASAAECSMYEQSHPNFILDGSHLSTGKCSTCASCHKSGVFMGTPKNCVACHNGDPARVTTGRSMNHIPTALIECNNCHNTTSFTDTWSMNHTVVTGINCSQCHGGTYVSVYNAMKKPTEHVPTTAECGACHKTPAAGSHMSQSLWGSVSHETIHAGVTTGCVTCHDGSYAKGKKDYAAGHPVTSDSCEQCHSTSAEFKCADALDRTTKFASAIILKVKAIFA